MVTQIRYERFGFHGTIKWCVESGCFHGNIKVECSRSMLQFYQHVG